MVISQYTHGQLILLRQLIHTKDSDDILERLVVLENLLDSRRNIIVFPANLHIQTVRHLNPFRKRGPYDTGVQHARLRVERIDGRIDTELGNRP
jgi:hypothetical protein